MRVKSPFFHGFHKFFGGRKPASAIEKLLGLRRDVDVLCATHLTALFGAFLPADLLARKSATGAGSRERVFSRAVTFWAFLSQVLDPESSCRKAVARVQTLFALKGLKRPSQVTGAYCQARLRLPVRWLVSILEHITARLTLGQHGEGRLLVADGTSVALSDTSGLQARYPQPGGQKPGCGFPVMKLLALFDLRSGTLLDAAKHSAQDVAALYARRWRVELNFDDLKTTMRMEMMRTKSPAMICRELLLHMIAYNLLRAIMARAEVSVEKASFKGTVDRLSTWSWAIWLAPTRQQARARVEELLESIAADKVPHRPHRHEPRAVKRRPKPYALLNAPRHSMKEIPHRYEENELAISPPLLPECTHDAFSAVLLVAVRPRTLCGYG